MTTPNDAAVDVWAVLDDAERWARQLHAPSVPKMQEAIAAIRELVEADREFDESYVTDMDCPSSVDLGRFRRATLRRAAALRRFETGGERDEE